MAEHATPTTRAAGQEIQSEDINQFVRWLTGLMNSGITLGHNGASGGPTIKLVPSSNPAAGTKLLQITQADGSTERFALTADGQMALYGQLSMAKGADIASASALDLGTDGNFFHVTGTTTITSIESRPAGHEITLVFDGSLTVTHNATSLILLSGTNLATTTGVVLRLVSEGSGNWRQAAPTSEAVVHYFRRKSALETVNNSSTLQNDDHLSFPIGANEIWAVDLYLAHTVASATPGFACTFTLPAGGAMLLQAVLFQAPQTANVYAPTSDYETTPGTAMTLTMLASGKGLIHVHGILRTAGSSGTAQFQWAQAVANASDSTLDADSYMIAHRVG